VTKGDEQCKVAVNSHHHHHHYLGRHDSAGPLRPLGWLLLSNSIHVLSGILKSGTLMMTIEN
jgi:hypothetical protein